MKNERGAIDALKWRLSGVLTDIKSALSSGDELDKEENRRLYFAATAIDRFLEAEV